MKLDSCRGLAWLERYQLEYRETITQLRYFWLQMCRLFQTHTKVATVGYEVADARAFDDVVVSYNPPVNNDRGGVITTDYFQLKFHVSQDDAIRFDSLMDPQFIGATRDSLNKTG